jgi:DNA-binding transcriptional regulator YhcF (GntR family)
MKLSVDRDLPVPLGVQLRGLIEYGITCGELLPGARLPSVRELAEELGVAPMTVSQVYRELRDGGLIEARAGLGTFVTESSGPAVGIDPRLIALQRRLDGLTDEALALGLGPGELTSMLTARFARRTAQRPERAVVLVGVFPDATRDYARAIDARLGALATVVPTTVDALRQGEARIGSDRRAAALGNEGAEPRARLDQAAIPEFAIDLAHGHRRDPQLVGQLAHRWQPRARQQLAAGDAVFDQAAQLHAERHRQITVDGKPQDWSLQV